VAIETIDELGGNSTNKGGGGNITRHDGTRPNDCVIADSDGPDDDRATADITSAPDDDIAARFRHMVQLDAELTRLTNVRVLTGEYPDILAEYRVGPDKDPAAAGIEMHGPRDVLAGQFGRILDNERMLAARVTMAINPQSIRTGDAPDEGTGDTYKPTQQHFRHTSRD
jgi:hypothetical protein